MSFMLYFVGALAEIGRCPFDLLEADSEIVAGYNIEYSGMKFALFYLGEYGAALLVLVEGKERFNLFKHILKLLGYEGGHNPIEEPVGGI